LVATSTAGTRNFPDVIVVGPSRTGTTWLHRVLEGHVDLPHGVKEPQFFNTFYDKGVDWYARHFRYATGTRPIVEICPYFFTPNAPERIKSLMPNCRIVATMRDPVDRIYSVFKLHRHYGWVRHGTFDEVLNAVPHLGSGNRYAEHLAKWFEQFGRENVLVTLYDELRAEPQAYLNRVTDFIGIERIALSPRSDLGDDVNAFAHAPRSGKLAYRATTVMYSLKGHQAYRTIDALDRAGVWDFCHGRGELFPRLTPEQDARLRAHFMPEVEALEELMKIDLSAWKKPRASRSSERRAERIAG
jgi:Sulfotransferase domain